MHFIEFCEKNNILWMPNNITDGSDGGKSKQPIIPVKHEAYKMKRKGEITYICNMNEFKTVPIETIKQRQKCLDICNNVCLDTNKMHIVDLDSAAECENFKDLLLDNPYYLSIERKMPHIFCYLDDELANKGLKHAFKSKKRDLDLLHGQWSYIGKDTKIINADKPIKKIDCKRFYDIINSVKIEAPIETSIVEASIEKPIVKKPKKKTIMKPVHNIEFKNVNNETPKIEIDETNKYIDLLNIYSNDDCEHLSMNDWFKIGLALYNTKLDLIKEWHLFSSRDKIRYSEKETNYIWQGFKDGVKKVSIGSIIYNLKKQYPKQINEWIKKYSIRDTDDEDFWQLMTRPNDTDYAKLYYKLNSDKYIYTNKNWYEYNDNNILINYGKEHPPSLLNSIAEIIRPYILTKRNELIPPLKKDYDDDDKYKVDNETFKNKMAACNRNYTEIGDFKTSNNTIKMLKHLFSDLDIYNKFDDAQHLFAFNNKVYDMTIKQYRNIYKSDYITLTTGYDYIEEPINDDIRKSNLELLNSIFPNKEVMQYFMKITGLSLFSNKYESMYCLTGVGANGKGTLSDMIKKAIGNYFKQAPSTFITQIYTDERNPTLAQCKGVRYLLITEPNENANNECKLNIEFVNAITGRDTIAARDLYKSTIYYKPFFTPFLQCNVKPSLNKINNAVERRMKVLNFPHKFVDNPTEPQDRKVNRSLKDNIENNKHIAFDFVKLLIEYATEYYGIENIQQPTECIQATQDYLNENNTIKEWFDANYILSDDITSKNRIKLNDMKEYYNFDCENKDRLKSVQDLKNKLDYNKIKYHKTGEGYYYLKNHILKQKT